MLKFSEDFHESIFLVTQVTNGEKGSSLSCGLTVGWLFLQLILCSFTN